MTKNFHDNMLYNRQRTLLGIINILNENMLSSKLYLMKTLFLVKQDFPEFDYDFYPYQLGPFSQTVYWDLDYLKKQGLVESNEKMITQKGKIEIRINEKIVNKVNEITSAFSDKEEIKNFVYNKYPEYTGKSILLKHKDNKQTGKFTIGYEEKSLDFFMNQLIQNNVNKLIDVRKNAYSMKKGFSKSTLKETLARVGINYEHMPKLGIESDKRQELETKEDYEKLFNEYRQNLPKRKKELDYVADEGKKERIAIMCFEKDPNYCHRGQISEYIGGFKHL